MDFKTYYLSLDLSGREKLANVVNSSVPYLSQLAHGHRIASRKLASKIEQATLGEVSAAEMLFPTDKYGRSEEAAA